MIGNRTCVIDADAASSRRLSGCASIGVLPPGDGLYGRVTPHDIESIVENTIVKGLVLPPLLRGGLNLSKPNCKSLNDW